MTTLRRMMRVAAVAATSAVLLAACSGPPPEPEPEPTTSEDVPVLDEERLNDVLDDVQESIDAGDAELDAEALEQRLSGPALEMRQAEYRLAEATDGEVEPTPLTTASQVEVVAASEEWPRSVLVISEVPEGTNLPLLLELRQPDPRSQYMLAFWAPLLPGAQTPSTANPDAGSQALPPDAEGLVTTPEQTMRDYGHLLQDGEEDTSFGDDPFRTSYTESIAGLEDTVELAGDLEQDIDLDEDTTTAMATAEGGALVLGVLRNTLTLNRTVEGATLQAGGEMKELLGDDDAEITDSLDAEYLIPVAFTVPAEETGEDIQVLAADRIITDVARADDDSDEDE